MDINYSTLISLVALSIATTSTLIAYLLYRLTHDPEVIVYAIGDPKRASLINLVIENTGGSSALDVTFSSSEPLPGRAFGHQEASVPDPMSEGPLITGIPSLGPRATRVVVWGQYGGIQKGIGDRVVDVTAVYESKPRFGFRRRKHKTVSRLEIKSFEHTLVPEDNWDQKTAEALNNISNTLGKLTDLRSRSLKVKLEKTS